MPHRSSSGDAEYSHRIYCRFGSDWQRVCPYGMDYADVFLRAATYVVRILKGENAADLPVQTPTKLELVINVKAAKALGLEVPASLLSRADEVIE